MGCNPQESLENTVKTMGTLRGTPNRPLNNPPNLAGMCLSPLVFTPGGVDQAFCIVTI